MTDNEKAFLELAFSKLDEFEGKLEEAGQAVAAERLEQRRPGWHEELLVAYRPFRRARKLYLSLYSEVDGAGLITEELRKELKEIDEDENR